MVSAFLDTAILVDVLRGHEPAVTWLRTQTQGAVGITPIVWLELIEGAQNRGAQRQAAKLLSEFDMVYLTQSDMDWAMQRLLAYRLSHNIGYPDCLIASVGHRLRVPLYTRNLKHLVPLLGSLAQNPY